MVLRKDWAKCMLHALTGALGRCTGMVPREEWAAAVQQLGELGRSHELKTRDNVLLQDELRRLHREIDDLARRNRCALAPLIGCLLCSPGHTQALS